MNAPRVVTRLAFAASIGLLGCGSAGSGDLPGSGGAGESTGGAIGSGGKTSTGGATGTGTGGTVAGGTGGTTPTETGGTVGTGGTPGTGGGQTASGGTTATGGVTGTGGGPMGGSVGTGGAGMAGATGSGGNGGAAAGTGGAAPGTGGAGGAATTTGSVPLDPTLMSKCTGSSPIICTIPVPADGNYTVTVELGSATAASSSRVQAETYRIVVPEMALAAGAFSQQTFSVNVRMEKHDGYSAPSKILDLRIDGATPALHGLGFASTPNIPTIFVAGDSTVCDWDPIYLAANSNTAGILERGWAQELSQFFKPGIAVANYADSGETAGSFYGKFWTPAKALLRAGDYVFVQFGHNDQKSTADVAAFSANMMKYVTDALNAKATPVLITPPGRKSASTGNPGFGGLDAQTRTLAMSQKVTLVDLTMLSLAYYATLPNKSDAFANPSESTHFSETGATGLSKAVTTDLKAGTLPLAAFIK